MTDRELLEAAANAAGFYYHGARTGLDCNCYVSRTNDTDDWFIWSPLINDGDALRLAVQTGMLFTGEKVKTFQRFYLEELDTGKKPPEATRRAIVRTAR